MKVPATRLDRGFELHKDEYEAAALRVLRSGWYVLGREVEAFEQEFAAYVGKPGAATEPGGAAEPCGAGKPDNTGNYNCVGLASGLDALWITFKLLGIGAGDEVIVAANAYIACVMGITMCGATPVFVEPDEYYNIDVTRIEAAITPKTKAILAVHLYGQACNMEVITSIAAAHKITAADGSTRGLYVVEDCAQSHGAAYAGRQTGLWGDAACFSFYPTKNLGGFGDGGAVITGDAALAERFRVYRNYGSVNKYYNVVVGTNSRLDELQAALLRVRLSHLDELSAEREQLCRRYLSEIKNPVILLPKVAPGAGTVWHQFVVRISGFGGSEVTGENEAAGKTATADKRKKFIKYLESHGIGSIIHYPVPPHLSEAYEYLGFNKGAYPLTELYADTVLSLPLYSGMTKAEQDYVIEVINAYN